LKFQVIIPARYASTRFPGKPLAEILAPLDMSVDEFVRICDKFTNKKIFKRDANGQLLKDRFGNLTKLNYDNA
jgi:hypothetical protein